MGREFELKYRATPDVQTQISAAFGGRFESISMETTYYDTPDRVLAAQRYTLRRRMENGVSVCTVKTPAGDHGRGEWECVCSRIEDSISMLCQLGAPQSLQAQTAGGLVPICGARFIRLAKTLEAESCRVELALDQGCLMGGGKEIPLCEVEVELKSGDDAQAIAFANALAEKYGLVPEAQSKYRRAIGLVRGA